MDVLPSRSSPAETPTLASGGPGEVTRLLLRMQSGDKSVESLLLPIVYPELHRIARAHLRHEARNHSLQPTALVNEAYLRFTRGGLEWKSRLHFFAVAANMMRRILVDHARARQAAKRGSGQMLVPLDDALVAARAPSEDTLELNQALERLEQLNQRQARVVELRYFGGLKDEEIATILEVSVRTVKRDWRVARAFLFEQLHS